MGSRPVDDYSEIEKLVERARAGDEPALAVLIARTQDRLFRFLYTLCGNRELAQDIVQECYVEVISRISQLRASSAFMSWLFEIGKNRFLDHVKSPRQKSEPFEEGSVERALVEQDPNPVNAMDIAVQVHRALQSLDVHDRLLILLVDQEGYSYRETADILGVTEDAVRSRLHRARVEFAKTFK
jgi:RNA polymerase sigma-70 factor, ECF subfamily